MIIALASVGTSWASAIDLGALELGVTYDVPAFKSVEATFTAPASGKLTINGGGLDVYSDPAHNNLIQGRFTGIYENGGVNDYTVTEGTTYYLFNSFTMGAFPMTLYMDGVQAQPLEVYWVSPAEKSTWNLANYSNLIVTFNQNVNVDNKNASIVFNDRNAGDASTTINVRLTVSEKDVYIPVEPTLRSLLQAGRINPGDPFKIGIRNVTTASGAAFSGNDAEGYVWFNFSCGSIPVVKTAETVPSSFLSYWRKGASEGQFSITFDGELGNSPKTVLTLGYGNLEGAEGEYYAESIPLTIDGNTITADFTGKLRTPVTMTPLYAQNSYSTVTLSLNGVVDKYGNPVASPGQGTVGSYGWQLNYTEIPRATISAEFTPANGTTLEGAENISVYINGANDIAFTGFNISYQDGTETKTVKVEMSDVTVSDASTANNEATYTFAIPAEVKGKSRVTVTLADAEGRDGYDHSNDVQAIYDGFVVTYADPANGSELAGLPSGTIITINTNYAEKYPEMYITYEITDLNAENPDEAFLKYSWLNRQEDGSYSTESRGNLKFLQGHVYKVEFTAWKSEMDKNYGGEPVGSDAIYWNGTTPPYRYSEIQFVSITPDQSTVLSADDREFTVEFDGMVTLDSKTTFINLGMGSSQPFESITAVDGLTETDGVFANKWILVIPESFMKSNDNPIDFAMQAKDLDGLILQGNNGIEDNSYFTFHYNVAAQYADFETEPANGATIEKLTSIDVLSERGIMPSYNMPAGSVTVMNMTRDIVATVTGFETHLSDTEGGSDEINTRLTLTLDNEVTENGTYIVNFPQGYFAIDVEFSSQFSADKTISFTIDNPEQPIEVNVKANPAEGNVTVLPAEIILTFVDEYAMGPGSGRATLAIDGGEAIELSDLTFDWDDELNVLRQPLPQEYTENGTYVISFPEGYFLVGDDAIPYPAFTLTYTIGGSDEPVYNITTDPAQGYVKALGPQIKITFNDCEEIGIVTGEAYLSINGGERIKLEDTTFDWDDPLNVVIQNLPQTYTEAGTYVITFAAGAFSLNGTEDSKEFSIEYIVDTVEAIEGIDADSQNGFRVYDLNGINVLNTENYGDVKQLRRGFYIVNGRKVYIR